MMRLFNLLLSPIGRVASRPMRNIETFPSKQMYLYLSLVERKVAEFYHNMVKMTYFHCFLRTIDGVLAGVLTLLHHPRDPCSLHDMTDC